MEVLFIGDIVGKPGRAVVEKVLPGLIDRWKLDLVIANAENAAGGSGINKRCFDEIRAAGVDVLTMGDHVYRKRDILQLFEETDLILKPANYPPDSPGPSWVLATTRSGVKVAVFCLLGRVFMRPVDCPFLAADRMLETIGEQAKIVFVDIHAEATSDKQLMGRYLDGRVSGVFGTHTHVPTADEKVLPQGTAYITDVGMAGPYESILGRRIGAVSQTTVNFVPTFFDVATGDARLCGVHVSIDERTGLALSIHRVMIRETESASSRMSVGLSSSNHCHT